mgnify:CR=1 FL=1
MWVVFSARWLAAFFVLSSGFLIQGLHARSVEEDPLVEPITIRPALVAALGLASLSVLVGIWWRPKPCLSLVTVCLIVIPICYALKLSGLRGAPDFVANLAAPVAAIFVALSSNGILKVKGSSNE